MSVNKNFFIHDLAAVALIGNGAHRYLKEWLDYHLAAGVEHFFLYDNTETEDNREVLKPYIEEQQVDCFQVPGEKAEVPIYNDAVRRFRFICRYMAFINLDEFIFPKTGQSITEVVDEVLSNDSRATALVINRQVFGSNHRRTADYDRGVLDRFTRRAPSDWFEPPADETPPAGNIFVKTIANPRYIRFIINPHFAYFFEGKFAVNSAGGRVPYWGNEPILADKIVINDYVTKSREEFNERAVDTNLFSKNDRNDERDTGILEYRDKRMETYTPPKKFDRESYFQLLEKTLLPAVRADVPDEFFEGKLETFLTCRSLSGILRRSFPKDNRGKFMEEASLRALNRTHFTKMSFSEIMLMISAMPHILGLPYPVVDDIRKNCMSFVRQIMGDMHRAGRWDRFVELGNYLDLLAAFGARTAPQNEQ